MTPRSDGESTTGLLQDRAVGAATAALADQRRAIHQRLLAGASGAEVMAALTELVDGLLIGRYREAVRTTGGEAVTAGFQHCCLVALGGYGRRELAPYSDIDIMFLFRPEAGTTVASLSRQVLHHLWDIGFQVGHSVRTIQDCVELAATDVTIQTSMMEARFLAGSPDLFQDFQRRYLRRVVARGADRYIERKIAERRREYEKFGETVYLLEPNVKKSKGGLRDLHVLQWAGMARYQAGTLQELADRGILSRQDYQALLEAREFLWRVRALLHVHAGNAQEILTFDEQVRLAERFGFQDRPSLLAVEQFMQQYYRHTMGLHERCARFVDRCRRVPVWRRLARLLDPDRSNGLPAFLVAESGLNSGFMLAQYTAASLVSESKSLAHPASVDSIPSSAGQEDHVSMGMTSARHAREIVTNAEVVVAIEALVAAQGLDLRAPLEPAQGTRAAREAIRGPIPFLAADRELGPDIEAATELIRNGELVRAVESAVGDLD